MSFTRLLRSTRKRRCVVTLPSNESREELDYEGTENCILQIENDLQQLRKKLKAIKRSNKTTPEYDLGDVERHIKPDIHQHMRSLNQHFGLKYDEVNELERKIGNRNNEIEELNINLKEKDRQITSLHSKLKDKDTNVKALQQQFSEAEAESLQKSTEEGKNTLTTELKKNQEELIIIKTKSAFQEEKQRIVHNFQEELKSKDKTIKRFQEQLRQNGTFYKCQIEQIYAANNKEITRLNEQLQQCDKYYKCQIEQIYAENEQNDARLTSEANSRENTIELIFSQLDMERAAKEDERKQKDDVLTRLKSEASSREDTIKHLSGQLGVERAAKEDERKQKDDDLASFSLEITSLQKQLEQRERDIESLQKSKEEEKNTIAVKLQENQEELMKKQSALQGEKQNILHGFQEELKNKDNTNNRLQEQLRQDENFYKCKIEQIYAANTKETTRFTSEASSRENTIKHLLSELEVTRAGKENERKQKEDVLTRLSAVAGDPGIMELSDPNRPMKIAEKFTEMYDTYWIDSMEALEDLNIPEEKCVEILLHFVTDSYEECGHILHELDGYLEKAVIVWESEDETNQPNRSSPSKDGLPAKLTKLIKDYRRTLAAKSVLALQKKLPQHLQNKRGITEDQMKACKKYIEDCIRYTWVMQIQDPPVYIEWEFSRDSTIDTNILRSYTRAGDKVDFVVWPVLYLHKDGPVLNKGVVQPIPHAQ